MRSIRLNLWRRLLRFDWPERLTVLFAGLFLYQFVGWIEQEEGLWLSETVTLVNATLLTVGLSYLIPRLNTSIRITLQLVAIIAVHGWLLDYHAVSIQVNSVKSLLHWGWLNGSQFEPFIWFSLSAWLVYHLTLWLTQSKRRIFFVIVLSVLFFAIRDSFSTLYLWPQVAMVVFCGLSLLVLRHFSELKNRAPVIWQSIMEYPASIGIPIVLIIALILCIGALAPTVDPILTDPYTAWKISRGESVPLLGKGVTVSASTADTSSGYSRDDHQLGGGFRFDYSPVMTVDTSKRTYFRGETRSLYNGKGWELSETEKRLPLSTVDGNVLRGDSRFNTSLLQTKEVSQTIEMNNQEQYPVLFGGFMIQKVEELNKGESQLKPLRWSPRQAELRFVEKEGYPNEYKLVTQEPVIDEDGLRKVQSDYARKPEWREYLQLPEELPDRVRQLAADITKDAGNSYDKARNIESYLRDTFPYTNTPDESKGESEDFVDRFLFEVKEGYCDYYSTSMVVLARSVGLPARWVKGYSSGQMVVPEEFRYGLVGSYEELDPDGGGTYTVRNSDAHSWAEVYFDGYGWLPFEPTSGFSLPNSYPEAAPQPIDLPDAAPLASPAPLPETGETSSWIRLASVTASCVVLLAAGVYLIWRKRELLPWYKNMQQKQTINFNQKIVMEFEKLLRSSRRKGYTRLEHETMREAVIRWAKQSKWMKKELDLLLDMFEQAKYSRTAATEQDYLRVTQTIEKLKEQMK